MDHIAASISSAQSRKKFIKIFLLISKNVFKFYLFFQLLGFILSIAAIIFTYYSDGFAFDLKFLGNLFATVSSAGSAILYVKYIFLKQKKILYFNLIN